MNFHSALLSTYREHPCQVLPNAFWKTAAQLGSLEAHYNSDGERVNHLEAWDEHKLLVHWNRDRTRLPPFIRDIDQYRMVLLHQDFLPALPAGKFQRRKPYFRLIYSHTAPAVEVVTPEGFHLSPVNPLRDTQAISDFISMCYAEIHPPAEVVFTWTQHPVFDPTLWVWAINQETGIPAGLGIAEYDPEVNEGSLEWIQVVPQYRGRGVGKMIVNELLHRLQGRAVFTTVSGDAESESYPQGLYRRCGFGGQDIWWVCRS